VIIWHAFSVLVLRDALGLRLFRDHVGQPENLTGSALYHAWLMLFFGGLIAAVGASQRRRSRMLSALRSAELRRATSQQRLAQAQLASLEARVDPDYLYQTLSRLERLYEADPPAADQLLDELIAFLRDALTRSASPQPREIT
jgi:sensor histidine kinase YesM